MQYQIILYNGTNSPLGRKTKITSIVQENNLKEIKQIIDNILTQ